MIKTNLFQCMNEPWNKITMEPNKGCYDAGDVTYRTSVNSTVDLQLIQTYDAERRLLDIPNAYLSAEHHFMCGEETMLKLFISWSDHPKKKQEFRSFIDRHQQNSTTIDVRTKINNRLYAWDGFSSCEYSYSLSPCMFSGELTFLRVTPIFDLEQRSPTEKAQYDQR